MRNSESWLYRASPRSATPARTPATAAAEPLGLDGRAAVHRSHPGHMTRGQASVASRPVSAIRGPPPSLLDASPCRRPSEPLSPTGPPPAGSIAARRLLDLRSPATATSPNGRQDRSLASLPDVKLAIWSLHRCARASLHDGERPRAAESRPT
jgi:hypothetical protein